MTLYATGRLIPEVDRVYWQLSALLARKNYAPLKLYADSASAKRLIEDWGIVFDEVDTTTIARETRGSHPMCWSAGKLAAMRSMAEQNQAFFHIDGDAFVFNRLSPEVENAKMFAQCVEKKVIRRTAQYKRNTHYPINELLPMLDLPRWMSDYLKLSAQGVINMGIFGGSDCASIYEYAELALRTFVRNRRNVTRMFSFNRSKPHWLGIAAITEQWSLGAYCHWKKIEPAAIMHRIDSFNLNRAHEIGGYVHLYSALRRLPQYRHWAKHKLRVLLNEAPVVELAKAA